MIFNTSPYFYVKILQKINENSTNSIIRFKLKAQANVFASFRNLFQLLSGKLVNFDTFKQNPHLRQLYICYISKNIKKIQKLLKSLEKESVLKPDSSNELNEIYHLQKANLMSFLLDSSNTLQQFQLFSQNLQTETQIQIQTNTKTKVQPIFKQIINCQFLIVQQKLKRFELVSKSQYHGKFLIRNNEVFVNELQNLGDKDKFITVKKLLQNHQKFILCQTEKKTLSKKFNLFLLNYYKSFKKDVGFYPPKLSLKYVMFNTVSKQFQISCQYLILWCLGLINQPLTYLQKVNFIEKNNRGGQFYMEQNQIYINPVKTDNLKKNSCNNIKQKYFQSKFQQIALLIKLQNQKNNKEKLFQNNQEVFEEFFNLKSKTKDDENEWNDIDQFVGVYNYVMSIYHFSNGHAYKFLEENKIKKQMSQKNIQHLSQKLSFAMQCLQNKKKLWSIFYESVFKQDQKQIILFEMEKQISISFQQINLILIENPEKAIKNIQHYQNQFKAEAMKIKSRKILILNFLSFVVDSSSNLLITIHNPIRYVLIYLLCQLNKYISMFETQQFERSFKYGEYVMRRKVIESSKIKKHQEKLEAYKQKTYIKLCEYANGNNQQLKNMMDTKLKIYMEKIEKWQSENDLIQRQEQTSHIQIIQIVDLILKLVNQLIMKKKLINIKNLQFKHQLKKTQNQGSAEDYPLEQEMVSFCCNTMQLNNYLLLVLTTILKDLPTQNLLLQNSNIKSLQQIQSKHQSLIKKVTQAGVFQIKSILDREKIDHQWIKIKSIQFQLKKHVAHIYGRRMIEITSLKQQKKKNEKQFIQAQNKNKNDKSYVQKIIDYRSGFLIFQEQLIEKLMQSEIFSMNSQKLTLMGLQCSQKLAELINLQLVNDNYQNIDSLVSSQWLQVLKMMNESKKYQKKLNKQEQQLFFIIKGLIKNKKIENSQK